MVIKLNTQPTEQQSRNPLKWGWYYVTDFNDDISSKLMSKRAARKWMKRNRYASNAMQLCKHNHAPNSFLRYFTFPLKTG